MGILRNTLVPFAWQHFGDNYRYQDDSATPHRAWVVLDFLQQDNATKMEQPAEIRIERLQSIVASMPRRLAAIIAARIGNT